MKIAAATFLGKFLLPILVTLACYRRIKSVDGYRLIWYGLIIGVIAISVFDFRRAVLGQGIIGHMSQRSTGATITFGMLLTSLIGGGLWMGYARAEGKYFGRGVIWLALIGLFGVLVWLSGSRSATIGLALLILWWLPAKIWRSLLRFKMLLLLLIGGIIIGGLFLYSLRTTRLDTEMTSSRLTDLWHQGFKGHNRWGLWVEGIEGWESHPVWGVGLNNWVCLNKDFASVHGSFVGILFDTGLIGFIFFWLFMIRVCFMATKKYYMGLSYENQQFFIGCRNSWIVYVFVMMVNLPFTSGQYRYNVFAYMFFFFPLLVMIVYRQNSDNYMGYQTGTLDENYALPAE
jgi:O-antigen ligase